MNYLQKYWIEIIDWIENIIYIIYKYINIRNKISFITAWL